MLCYENAIEKWTAASKNQKMKKNCTAVSQKMRSKTTLLQNDQNMTIIGT